jgi:CHAT domain-containing protein/tetratricopeptide (TPR) repeat protein
MATNKFVRFVTSLSLIALVASAITFGDRFQLAPPSTANESGQVEAVAANPHNLGAGESWERELAPTDHHVHQVKLEAGQYLHIVIERTAINIGLRLTAPNGSTVVQLGSRALGPTPLSALADQSGFYRLEIRSLESESEQIRGLYKLRVAELRAATAKDNQTIQGEQAFADGEQLLREWNSESSRRAIGKLREALSLWKAAGARGEEAEALKRIGDVYQRFGESSDALASYKEALSLGRRIKDSRLVADVLNEIGYVHVGRGEHQPAQKFCSEALRLSQTTDYAYGRARALNNLGEISYGVGKLQESLDSFQKALRLWRELGDRQGQALALLNLAYSHSDIGQMREALNYCNQALPLWTSARDQRGQGMTLTAIGRLHSRKGESQQALNYFEQAMQLIEPIGAPAEKGRILTGLAYVYNQLSKSREAIEYYEQALPLFRATGDYNGEAVTIYDAGDVLFSLGENQKALDYYQQALAISRAANDRRSQAFEIRQIGRVYASLGDKTKALANYHQALAFWRTEKDFRGEADALNLIAGIFEDRAETAKARELYARALVLSQQAEYRMGEAATLYNIARLERDRGNLNEARTNTESAIELIESLRTNVASQELRASYFASVRQHYELYMDVLMQLDKARPTEGFAAAAFAVSEKARARSLLESLQEARADIRQGVDVALLERERLLQQTLYGKTARHAQVLGSNSDVSEAEALSKEIDRLSIEYEGVRSQIRSSSPRYAALTQAQPLSLNKIQQQVLDDGSLMLEYSLGDERSYLWAITRSDTFTYELPGRAEIETAARNVYASLTASQPLAGETLQQTQVRVAKANEQLPAQIAQLSRIVLGPVSSQLGKKRLLIVPDGALQYVPFQILTASVPTNPGSAEASVVTESRALVLDHEIVNEPSASTLALLIEDTAARKQAAKTVAVFADPVFEADDPRISSSNQKDNSAASQAQETDSRRALRDVGVAKDGGHIPRLQASRLEAEAIMSVTPWWSGLQATGFEASRATVMRPDIGNYRILHFATHGLLNDEHPELSGVVLSLFDEKGQHQEGFLRLHDIYNLKLPVDLVVLSACNTGLGKDVRGEGLIGLTRGFMYAGASSVVASLWKVDDEATAELMRYFYGFMLKDGLSPAAALRKAQVSMSQQKRWQSPYYWSGFIIQGQYIQTERVRGWHITWLTLWAGMAVLLIVAAFFVLKRRRRTIL